MAARRSLVLALLSSLLLGGAVLGVQSSASAHADPPLQQFSAKKLATPAQAVRNARRLADGAAHPELINAAGHFVAVAYNANSFGYSSCAAAASAVQAKGKFHRTTTPPAGAVVFLAQGDFGNCGIADGNGSVYIMMNARGVVNHRTIASLRGTWSGWATAAALRPNLA